MNKYIIAFLLIIPTISFSQSLGSERIERLNKSVVRILIDTIPSGTGFFVHDSGWIATCHHVIEPAYIRDNKTNQITGMKTLYAEFRNGEKVELGIMTYLLNQGYKDAYLYDYSLLKTQTDPKTDFKTLKIGSWSNVDEGDIVYSCGYPLGIKQRFISQGILSTKWTDTLTLIRNTVSIGKFPREVAWLDLTMNKGNSGGAVIKLGETPKDDEVIGIATFILNPFANEAGQLADFLSSGQMQMDLVMGGISNNKINELYAKAIANNSIGVSGCISIDYVYQILRLMNPKK